MKKVIWIFILICFCAAGNAQQKTENKWKQHQKSTDATKSCLTCHTNDNATKDSPNLIKCPRKQLMMPGFHKVEEGP